MKHRIGDHTVHLDELVREALGAEKPGDTFAGLTTSTTSEPPSGARGILAAILEAKAGIEALMPGPREIVLSSLLPPIRVAHEGYDFQVVHPDVWAMVERRIRDEAGPYLRPNLEGYTPTAWGIPVFDHDAAMAPNRDNAGKAKAVAITSVLLRFLDSKMRDAIFGPRKET